MGDGSGAASGRPEVVRGVEALRGFIVAPARTAARVQRAAPAGELHHLGLLSTLGLARAADAKEMARAHPWHGAK